MDLSPLANSLPEGRSPSSTSHLPFRINDLPPELLSTIFTHCLSPRAQYTIIPWPDPCFSKMLGPPSRITSSAPHLLTQVCQKWRDIAVGTPRLWTWIYLNIGGFIDKALMECLGYDQNTSQGTKHVLDKLKRDLQILKLFLERAGALDVDVMVDYEKAESLLAWDFMTTTEFTRDEREVIRPIEVAAFEQLKQEARTLVKAILATIITHRRRIGRLDLTVQPELLDDAMRCLGMGMGKGRASGWEKLRSINFRGYESEKVVRRGRWRGVRLDAASMPRLERVTLRELGLTITPEREDENTLEVTVKPPKLRFHQQLHSISSNLKYLTFVDCHIPILEQVFLHHGSPTLSALTHVHVEFTQRDLMVFPPLRRNGDAGRDGRIRRGAHTHDGVNDDDYHHHSFDSVRSFGLIDTQESKLNIEGVFCKGGMMDKMHLPGLEYLRIEATRTRALEAFPVDVRMWMFGGEVDTAELLIRFLRRQEVFKLRQERAPMSSRTSSSSSRFDLPGIRFLVLKGVKFSAEQFGDLMDLVGHTLEELHVDECALNQENLKTLIWGRPPSVIAQESTTELTEYPESFCRSQAGSETDDQGKAGNLTTKAICPNLRKIEMDMGHCMSEDLTREILEALVGVVESRLKIQDSQSNEKTNRSRWGDMKPKKLYVAAERCVWAADKDGDNGESDVFLERVERLVAKGVFHFF